MAVVGKRTSVYLSNGLVAVEAPPGPRSGAAPEPQLQR
jgi:hypothetical protein